MNLITTMGYVARDPEYRATQDGRKFITFSIASNIYSKKEQKTIWYKCILSGENVPPIMASVHKGSFLIVCGDLDVPRAYINKKNDPSCTLTIFPHMIRFGHKKKEEQSTSGENSQGNNEPYRGNEQSNQLQDADIPF